MGTAPGWGTSEKDPRLSHAVLALSLPEDACTLEGWELLVIDTKKHQIPPLMHLHFSELPFATGVRVTPSSCPSFCSVSSSWALSSISSPCVPVVMVCPVIPASCLFSPSLRQPVPSQPSCHSSSALQQDSLQVCFKISLATVPCGVPGPVSTFSVGQGQQ